MQAEFVQHETGVIHGRFQVLHNDHLKYLLAGKRNCRHLIVGITNPDPSVVKAEEADPKRSDIIANPLTYYERYLLIRAAFSDAQVKSDKYSIVPFPISSPSIYKYYVPLDAVFYLTIYDDWGRRKKRYFESLGLRLHILWEIPKEQKGISAAEIRTYMMDGRPWEKMVPDGVAKLLKKWDIPERLKQIKLKQ